ncbi:MAG: hypothetical protein CNLJKLNK_00011 [Holosporales bacterium]
MLGLCHCYYMEDKMSIVLKNAKLFSVLFFLLTLVHDAVAMRIDNSNIENALRALQRPTAPLPEAEREIDDIGECEGLRDSEEMRRLFDLVASMDFSEIERESARMAREYVLMQAGLSLLSHLNRSAPASLSVRPQTPPDIKQYKQALLMDNGKDPKRTGEDYTNKEMSIASTLLQGVTQSEEAYIKKLEQVFAHDRAFQILHDIVCCENNASEILEEQSAQPIASLLTQ